MSDDRRLYLHDSKLNLRSDVDGFIHTKQLLNLLCIVYFERPSVIVKIMELLDFCFFCAKIFLKWTPLEISHMALLAIHRV